MKVHILYHNHPVSRKYADVAAKSCIQTKMPYEMVEGFSKPMDPNDAWNTIGLKRQIKRNNWVPEAQLCSAGHAKIWKMIADSGEDGIVFEHDAVMLHNIEDVEFPEDRICVLGYKVKDANKYLHEQAGPPEYFRDLQGHEGAHAYGMTAKTARKMLDEIEEHGVWSAVDNMFFLRDQRVSKIPMCILDPTPAIGWLRKSTIWGDGASEKNYKFIESFKTHYYGDS